MKRRTKRGWAPTADVSGPAPVQEDDTVRVPPAAWWEPAAVQLAALVVFLVARPSPGR
ncbi:hypothetical protein [Nonomuraea longispora]|uniref:hypothetical protein n=1 Tax=Nonomuraea longispora TaxID=1848320 RepID=UPI0014052BF7|nr:hypothetical protein [Nonomuraea longispora]